MVEKKTVSEETPSVVMVVKDKVESKKTGGWKQSFKLLDENGKTLAKADMGDATYEVIASPSGTTTEETKELVGTNLTQNPGTKVPGGNWIRITVELKGKNYEGTVTGTYRILKTGCDISKAAFKIGNKEYTGKEVELTEEDFTKASIGGKALTLGKEFRIAGYSNHTAKGTAKVTLKGQGEYGGEKTVTFKITQKDLEKNWYEQFLSALQSLFN